jgi:hypothetical protein
VESPPRFGATGSPSSSSQLTRLACAWALLAAMAGMYVVLLRAASEVACILDARINSAGISCLDSR